MKQTHMVACLLCKKLRSFEQIEMLFEDGSPMCKQCGDEIRGGFSCYIEGKEVTKEEFNERTKKKEEDK